MIPHNLLPPDLMPHAFIAGGYAACPALAGDIDIWVTVPSDNLLGTLTQVLDWLRAHPELEYTQSHAQDSYEDLACTVLHVGRVGKYQIMLTTGNVHEVLAGFDISTHQIALTPEGIVKGPDWTPLHVPPVQLRTHHMSTTRLAKFKERYKDYCVMHNNIRDAIAQIREAANV